MTSSLADIISHINARRNKVRYDFQELALMLADKLGDKKSTALYMRLAKNDEQELIMKAFGYTIASLRGEGNKGKFFMWKLKKLKEAPLEPTILSMSVNENIIPLFLIQCIKRANYVFAVLAHKEIIEKYGEELSLTVERFGNKWYIKDPLIFRISNSIKSFYKDLPKDPGLVTDLVGESFPETLITKHETKNIIRGKLLLGDPVLTLVPQTYKIR